jgi:hypothetical protein
MEKVRAPFTKEQVESLKMYQNNLEMHHFTCCSPDNIPECQRRNKVNEGELIPTEEGWVCPCGKYKQDWCHDFMLTLPGGYIVE